jgi:hypothetical protein
MCLVYTIPSEAIDPPFQIAALEAIQESASTFLGRAPGRQATLPRDQTLARMKFTKVDGLIGLMRDVNELSTGLQSFIQHANN